MMTSKYDLCLEIVADAEPSGAVLFADRLAPRDQAANPLLLQGKLEMFAERREAGKREIFPNQTLRHGMDRDETNFVALPLIPKCIPR
jgi:hypothetical protein